jgi:hypothetical protein
LVLALRTRRTGRHLRQQFGKRFHDLIRSPKIGSTSLGPTLTDPLPSAALMVFRKASLPPVGFRVRVGGDRSNLACRQATSVDQFWQARVRLTGRSPQGGIRPRQRAVQRTVSGSAGDDRFETDFRPNAPALRIAFACSSTNDPVGNGQ